MALAKPTYSKRYYFLNARWDIISGPERKTYFTRFSEIQAEYSVGLHRVSYKAKVRFQTDDKDRDEIIGKSEQWRVSKKGKPGKWIGPSSEEYYFLQDRGWYQHPYYFVHDGRVRTSVQRFPTFSSKSSVANRLAPIIAAQQFKI
jgi:hypothetical protein